MDDLGMSLTPLAGGHSGRTFLGEAAGHRVVVRTYPAGDPRGSQACDIDAAVLRRVRGSLPVPEVVDVRRSGGSAMLVTSWMAGERGDVVLPGLDDAARARFGRAMGRAAATLAGMLVQRPGQFRDGDLAVAELPGSDLPEWVETRLSHWSEGHRSRLTAVARIAQDRLEAVDRPCLVHSDLNPKNVLVDPASLDLTAVVDWEFAHAGHPWTDVGNLLRFERDPVYVEAVLRTWTELRGGDVTTVRDGARSADLWALIDLAAREGDNPVADRAATLLRAIGDAGDVHAWPWGSDGRHRRPVGAG